MPDSAVSRANGEEVREALDAEAECARELGIFGSPTFVCGSAIFWGDERFEDAIEWAKSHPA
jgi:2-hydroxychromene-2-carboxylate isomerase